MNGDTTQENDEIIDERRRATLSLKLGSAVFHRDAVEAKRLLDEGADPNDCSRGVDDRTLLMEALSTGDVDMVRLLLAHGADVSRRDNYGRTVLHAASGTALTSPAVVGLLMDAGADVNARDGKGNAPLHTAAVEGKRTIAKALLAHGADINATGEDDLTPLHIAADNYAYKGSGVFETLMDHGPDVNRQTSGDVMGNPKTALSILLGLSDWEQKSMLLDDMLAAGAEPAGPERRAVAEGFYGFIRHGSEAKQRRELFTTLLQAGMPASGIINDYTGTLLHAVCANQSSTSQDIQLTLEHGGKDDVNRRHAHGGDTPLMAYLQRAENGKTLPLEGLRQLLEAGADPSLTSNGSRSALDIAREHNLDKHIDVLLEYGADLNKKASAPVAELQDMAGHYKDSGVTP